MKLQPKNAILLHLFYTDLWLEYKTLLEPILALGDSDLYVTIVDSSIKSEIEQLTPNVYVVENRGLDIGPFILLLDKIKEKHYNSIFKVHSKKSIHHGQPSEFGENWRRTVVNAILGSVDTYRKVSDLIENHTNTMCGAKEYFYTFQKDAINIHHHYSVIKNTINKLALNITERQINNSICFGSDGNFFAGTMFATSHDILKGIFTNCNMINFYHSLPLGYIKNSNAHAMERIFGYYVDQQRGYYKQL